MHANSKSAVEYNGISTKILYDSSALFSFKIKDIFLNSEILDLEDRSYKLSSTDEYQKKIKKYLNNRVTREFVNEDAEFDSSSYFLSNSARSFKISSKTSSVIDDTAKEQGAVLQKTFENKLLNYIENEEIGLGTYTEADKLIELYLDKYNDLIQLALSDICSRNQKKIEILCKLLLLISRLDPKKISKTGYMIAMGALNHISDDVKEHALRVYENFSDKKSLDFLETSKVDTYWIQEYKEEIIAEIKMKYGL